MWWIAINIERGRHFCVCAVLEGPLGLSPDWSCQVKVAVVHLKTPSSGHLDCPEDGGALWEEFHRVWT